MRFFLFDLGLSLKAQLRSPKSWLLLLLLPALTAALVFGIPKEELAAPVQVGVVLPEGQGEAFWQLLEGRSDAVVAFVRCGEDTMRAKVATGQWDCGMVLCEDFDGRLKALRTDGVITFYTGSGSTVYPMVQETAAAAVMELVSPGLALRYMEKKGIQDVYELEALAPEERVQVCLQTRAGDTVLTYTLAEHQLGGTVLGCLGLVLLIWALFGAMDLGKWFQSPAVKRLAAVRHPRVLLLSRGCAMLCVAAAGGVAAVLLLPQRLWALGALVPYLLEIWALALLLSRAEALWSALPSLMGGITLVGVLTGPILFDLYGAHPVADAVMDWLPLRHFLLAASGDTTALLRSWLLAGVLMGVFLLFWREKPNPAKT